MLFFNQNLPMVHQLIQQDLLWDKSRVVIFLILLSTVGIGLKFSYSNMLASPSNLSSSAILFLIFILFFLFLLYVFVNFIYWNVIVMNHPIYEYVYKKDKNKSKDILLKLNILWDEYKAKRKSDDESVDLLHSFEKDFFKQITSRKPNDIKLEEIDAFKQLCHKYL